MDKTVLRFTKLFRRVSSEISFLSRASGSLESSAWRHLLSLVQELYFASFPGVFGCSFSTSCHDNCCPNTQFLSFHGLGTQGFVWHQVNTPSHGDLRPKNWISFSLFPLTKRSLLPALGFWPIIWLFSLPHPVIRFIRATIMIPISPSLSNRLGLWSADSLTYILIYLLTVTLWGLLIQTGRGRENCSYLSRLSGRLRDTSIMSESDKMFNERDRRCAAVQLMLSTDSGIDNRTIASTLKMQIWIATNNRWWKQSFRLQLWSLVWFQVRATSCHLTSSKSAWKSTPKCTWMCWRVFVIPWCNQVASGRPWVWQQDSTPAHKSKETQTWLQKECYDFVPFCQCPLLPWPEPDGLLRLVIRRVHHQHDLPQHQRQPDRRHPPSIPAGASGKGMLPVPDPYRGGH